MARYAVRGTMNVEFEIEVEADSEEEAEEKVYDYDPSELMDYADGCFEDIDIHSLWEITP